MVKTKFRYPGLKPLLKRYGLTYRAIFSQFDKMRPDQFSNIVAGVIPETKGFLELVLGALERLGVNTTEEQLRGVRADDSDKSGY